MVVELDVVVDEHRRHARLAQDRDAVHQRPGMGENAVDEKRMVRRYEQVARREVLAERTGAHPHRQRQLVGEERRDALAADPADGRMAPLAGEHQVADGEVFDRPLAGGRGDHGSGHEADLQDAGSLGQRRLRRADGIVGEEVVGAGRLVIGDEAARAAGGGERGEGIEAVQGAGAADVELVIGGIAHHRVAVGRPVIDVILDAQILLGRIGVGDDEISIGIDFDRICIRENAGILGHGFRSVRKPLHEGRR